MRVQGFCDLNISVSGSNLKNTVIAALKLGYRTIAINHEFTDTWPADKTTKKKRKQLGELVIPHPSILEITDKDLQSHGIIFKPKILTRLSITYGDPSSPFLHKAKQIMNMYDLVAFTPTTDLALKQVCLDSTIADIISLDYNQIDYRMNNKMLRKAVERDIYFELSYGPCIGNDSSRQNMFILAAELFKKNRSKNIIVTSRASNVTQLKRPYDVMNLAQFFNLTLPGAKESIIGHCHNVIHIAERRRRGGMKCAAEVNFYSDETNKKTKYDGLDDAASLCLSKIEIHT